METASKGGAGRKATVLFVATILAVSAVVGIAALTSGQKPSQRSTTGTNGQTVAASAQGLDSFQSDSQLQAYVATNAKSAQNYEMAGGGAFIGGPVMLLGGVVNGVAGVAVANGAAVAAPEAASASTPSSSPSFTGTNVQVQGVDEPDLVKTDGTHLFVATNGTGSISGVNPGGPMIPVGSEVPGSSSNASVTIMNAYPTSSMGVLSTVTLPGSQILGIEVSTNRLAVVDQRYTNSSYIGLLLFDTTNLSSPKLMDNMTIEGSYVGSRLAGGYIYEIVQQPSYQFDSQGNATGVLPRVSTNGDTSELPPTSVYYTPGSIQISAYTMVVSMSMASGAQSTLSVLTGLSSTVFVSTSNIYVVYTNYREYANADDIPGDAFTGGAISPVIQESNSTIFRASYSNGTVAVQAVGSVPGSVLNQFSMNEYDGYFQVATSRFATIDGSATRSDDVYVLNQGMNQVAALQNIAPGENLYAVRFVGDMGYVVTFEQVDPLFAISFATPTQPVILSALKVNGYSDYLQQLFPGYLIGVGKNTVAASNGDFAYYLGLKLSLFHVEANGTSSDVQDYLIGDRGTDSPVLTNHLAFTWDAADNITVIPVLLYKVADNQTSEGGIPPYGNPVWQGAYVVKVSTSGFTLLGTVSQYPAGMNYGDSPNNNLQIDRSVIIGNVLYTISGSEVMASDLTSFATISTVTLPGS